MDDSAIASRAIVAQSSAAVVELTDNLDRPVDLLVAVREREKHRLELRRRDVDAVREEVAEEARVAIGIARLRVLEVAHLTIGIEEGEHRAHAIHPAEVREPGFEPAPEALELFVDRQVA